MVGANGRGQPPCCRNGRGQPLCCRAATRSRHLPDSEGGWPLVAIPTTTPTSPRRAGILKAADAASERLAALRRYLSTDDADVVPCAVAEATRLEGLAHDILAHCRVQDWL